MCIWDDRLLCLEEDAGDRLCAAVGALLPLRPMAEGRRERRKREVRQRIRKAASHLLAKEGLNVNIEAIAEAADVSRATFFNYFPNKSALLDDLAGRITERLDEGLLEVRQSAPDLATAIETWFVHVARSLGAREALNRVLFVHTFGAGTSPEARRAHMQHALGMYAGLIEDAQARGEVHPEADVAFLSELLAGAVHTLVNGWLNEPGYPVERRARQAARFLHKGIVDEGPKLD